VTHVSLQKIFVINNSQLRQVKHGVMMGSFVAVRPDPKYGDKFWIGQVVDANSTSLTVKWLEHVEDAVSTTTTDQSTRSGEKHKLILPEEMETKKTKLSMETPIEEEEPEEERGRGKRVRKQSRSYLEAIEDQQRESENKKQQRSEKKIADEKAREYRKKKSITFPAAFAPSALENRIFKSAVIKYEVEMQYDEPKDVFYLHDDVSRFDK